METLNNYTLKLKLDRHNLNHSFSDDGSVFTLGGTGSMTREMYTQAYLPIGFGLACAFGGLIGLMADAPAMKLMIICGISILLYGYYNYKKFRKKKEGNRDVKQFKKGEILIHNIYEGDFQFTPESIKKLDVEIDKTREEQGINGTLFLIDKNAKRHNLLEIIEKKKKHIDEDLNYLKNYIESLVGLENRSTARK